MARHDTTRECAGSFSHAAARLLLSVSKNVKFSSDPVALVGDLFSQAQRSLQYLEPKTAAVVREALLCLALTRSTPAGAGARGEAAARTLLAAWSAPLHTLGPAHTLPPLTAVLLAFSDAPTYSKKIIAEGILSAAEAALRMLCAPACAGEAELTDFFLALFTSLLQQLGAFTYTAIDVFLQVAQRGGSDASLERLVECVRLGVETGAGGVRVPPVLALLTEHALPRAPAAAPDLARATHRLLASVLIHRWRYFFPNKPGPAGEEERRMAELRAALTALGRSLLEPDIEVFRLSIETLDTLNTKWKLYHKVLFRTEFLAEFLSVLLIGVGERGGGRALLREEVIIVVSWPSHGYLNMAIQPQTMQSQ
ncbi:unnamed protein product [Plutella xylostella]|uniref:(diamondback moth) hypothetical protein n=1 Tax=Plutella xylostella TaxID=51655 RepID=A0A8S4DSZ6_PLUXY|nr:unnamed protein product [Plutella xylostella]